MTKSVKVFDKQNNKHMDSVIPARVGCYQHSFFIRVIKLWNNLPKEL